jgi:hypothetical protein
MFVSHSDGSVQVCLDPELSEFGASYLSLVVSGGK